MTPNPPRLSAEDAFLELLTETLETWSGRPAGNSCSGFLRSIAHVDLTETQSIEIWEQALTRKRELSESFGKNITLQAALVDVLASANLLRLPIMMEYEELRKLQINAATDPLTGLYNRRFFDEYFEKELNRSIRYSHRLALVTFDLHRFKDVNDRYGHPQGDVLLQMAAATLRKSLRTSDYAFRIGGDEFALLLPQSDTEQAAALSRRLRAAYAVSIEPLRLGIPLALDFGLAVYPDDGDLQEILTRVADERLYQLKNGARSAPRQQPQQAHTLQFRKRTEALPSARAFPRAAADPGRRRPWSGATALGAGFAGGSRAYALIGEEAERTARVLDLGYGGVALETSRPEVFEEAFHAVLHVPILPPVRVSLRRVYQGQGSTGGSRIGCSFVT